MFGAHYYFAQIVGFPVSVTDRGRVGNWPRCVDLPPKKSAPDFVMFEVWAPRTRAPGDFVFEPPIHHSHFETLKPLKPKLLHFSSFPDFSTDLFSPMFR